MTVGLLPKQLGYRSGNAPLLFEAFVASFQSKVRIPAFEVPARQCGVTLDTNMN